MKLRIIKKNQRWAVDERVWNNLADAIAAADELKASGFTVKLLGEIEKASEFIPDAEGLEKALLELKMKTGGA